MSSFPNITITRQKTNFINATLKTFILLFRTYKHILRTRNPGLTAPEKRTNLQSLHHLFDELSFASMQASEV
jgi:hypothetical protein